LKFNKLEADTTGEHRIAWNCYWCWNFEIVTRGTLKKNFRRRKSSKRRWRRILEDESQAKRKRNNFRRMSSKRGRELESNHFRILFNM